MTEKTAIPGGAMSGLVANAVEYMVDAGQRSVLFLEILRQRGDQYREHVAQTAPHVLSYAAELIIDGRKLEQPVNYALVEALRRMRQADESARMTLAEFKMLVREQFFMLLLDRDAALAAIPKLLPENVDERRQAFAVVEDVLSASAEISGEVAKRLKQVAGLFGLGGQANTVPFDRKARAP
jgi:hypothetical protein